jgi:formimidoylglutamate deiminase
MVQTLALWLRSALLPDGWANSVRLTMEDGRIAGIARDVEPATEDERHELGLPGLPNVHSHGFQRGMAGLTEYRGPREDDFWTWREAMYRFLDRLEPDDVEAVTALAYVEMLEAGFTHVGEFHYLHHAPDGGPYANPAEMTERVASAAARTGIGITLLPVLYAHSTFGGAPPSPGQRRFISDLDAYARLVDSARRLAGRVPGGRWGVAPHSLRAVTPAELRVAVQLAEAGPVHIHAAEQLREVEDCIAWSGQRPVDWLLAHENVDRRWCLVHSTHMTADETARLAESGAVAGLCPITEANLGDGHFSAVAYLDARGAFGIGTDSNVRIDAAEELRTLEYSQRLLLRARNVLGTEKQSTGRRLFDCAVTGGSRALGSVGGLAVGASADVVTLDADHVALASRNGDTALDSWIFSGGREAVDCVWRHGRQVVRDGRHIARDAIALDYRRVMARLLAT